MKLDSLLSPVSEQLPCGPDLDEIGDNEYYNYVISAESRFPDRFIDLQTGEIDRKTIRLEDERKQIEPLLMRSRDIRLLVLMAQFESFTGDLLGFAATLKSISAILSTFWNEVHPKSADDDMELRRLALEALDQRSKVVLPLGYAALFSSRRAGVVSLRAWQIASKPEIAYKHEQKFDLSVLKDAFAAAENREAVDAAFAAVIDIGRSLKDIRGQFLAEGFPMPAFDNLETMVAELSHLFTGNAPHLVASADQTEEMEKEPAAETAVAPSPIPVSSPTAHITVQTHYEAKKVLVALESYFAKNEPSSPALILVHQAQLLIGRPLVEALTALASGRAPILNIDQRFGFFLDMDAMKQLTIEIPAEEERYGGGTAQDFLIQNRENAVASMLGVEAFLARKEPSSPVLMLLERARSFLDTNFLHILKELLPEEKKQ